jgi:cobalt-zinc-cadmium efflux system outer membrane protein
LSQPVEIAGERAARVEASHKLGVRLQAELAATRWEVRRNVVYAFNAAVVAKEQAEVAMQVQQFAEELLHIVQRRLAAGEATAIDLRVAELDVVTAKQAVLAAQQSVLQARLRLAESAGWSAEEPPKVNGGLSSTRLPPLLSSVLASTERHPTLMARRAAIGEAQSRKELAEREGTLTPVVGVQVSREGAAGSPANYILLGTLGVPLPIWQRNQQQRAETRVAEAVAEAEARALHQVTRVQVARAHAEMSAAHQRLLFFTNEVAPRLDDSLALLRRGFEAGEIPLLDVTVARERFLTARRDALVAYADYYRAAVDLEFATGADLNTFAETGAAQ